MRKNILNKVLLIGLATVAISCKSKKMLTVARTPVDTATATSKLADSMKVLVSNKLTAIRAKQVNFNTFSGKAQAKLDIDGNSNNVTLNIRIQRDQRIWVSVTAIAGIEVARALITPDSILTINRLQGVYAREPFSFIYKYASKQVNYKTVESLLVGNAIPELLNENADFKPADGNILVSGNLEELLYKLIIGPDLKVSQTNLSNQAEAQSMQVNNSAFIMAANRVIPSEVDITSAAKDKKILINLHYSKVDFDQALDYQFVIPKKYTRAD